MKLKYRNIFPSWAAEESPETRESGISSWSRIIPCLNKGKWWNLTLLNFKYTWLGAISTSLVIGGIGFSALKAAQVKSVPEGFGLLAHWSFDVDYSSNVNNDLYQGKPVGESSVQIVQDRRGSESGEGCSAVGQWFRLRK